MTFQAHPIPRAEFAPLFDLPEEALARHRAIRVTATEKPGFPDRIAMRDAEVGDTLLLVNYEHQGVDSPYRSSHAVYVSPTAASSTIAPGELPPYFSGRTIALRAFDRSGMMVSAELVQGEEAAPVIEALLALSSTAYLHAHFAKYGCFAARIVKADSVS